ncbi:MAG: hypothetical protein RI580_16410 [Halothece sp. Uz-M2-17]|nr:hypothetical protein [Halothece sp. Uz-M2-17]
MTSTTKPHFTISYKPIISPEHGVYGCLTIALMLFILREIVPDRAWNKK